MTPKVDTFEHDIANEIRRKEASLAEIEAVSKQSSPHQEIAPQKKLPWPTIILAVLLVLSLIGIGGVAYYYFNDSLLPPSSQEVKVTKNDIPKVLADLTKISPTLGTEIGRFISSVEKKETGYVLSITNYSAVFAYMTRNENAYIEEIAKLFPALAVTTPAQTQPTSTQQISTSTTSTSTTQGTSTKQIKKITQKATTTIAASSSEVVVAVQESAPQTYFSDLTLANQNMRVYKKENVVVVYSFLGDNKVLISNTPEGILALKSAILR